MTLLEKFAVAGHSFDELQAGCFRAGADEYAVLCLAPLEIQPPAILTCSERVVFHALLSGHSNTEIAALRSRSVRTVANQVAAIFQKLKVGCRPELIAKYG